MAERKGDALFDQKAFASRVRLTEVQRGLSGRGAAKAAGVSSATYSRVTRGFAPDVETYLRLMKWMAD